jgi:hypothetical protein
MSDQENFLERWSRRKRAAESTAGAEPKPETERESTEPARPAATTGSTEKRAPRPAAPFDVASLPSIESITAASDVRAFLAPGVPPSLTRAALRRVWIADPAIRDFVGLQECDWDFTDPKGIAGFGDLPADLDVERLVRQVFGEPDERPQPAAEGDDDAAAGPHVQHAQIAAESGQRSDEPVARARPDDERLNAKTHWTLHRTKTQVMFPCSATTMLQRTIVLISNEFPNRSFVADTAVRCLKFDCRHSLQLLTHHSVGRYLYLEMI